MFACTRPSNLATRSTRAAMACILALSLSTQVLAFEGQVAPVERPVQQEAQAGAEPRLIQVQNFIRAMQARTTYNVSGAGLTVAVLDTGIRPTHDDFDGRIVAVRNFTDDNGGNPNNAQDGHGHGTNVAGIVAANGMHTGIAPNASIVALKVLRNSGAGSFGDIEDALDWVLENHEVYNISVVNLSLGDGGNYAAPFQHGIQQKFAALREARVAVVVAAGNNFYGHQSAQGMGFPAIYAETVSVGAVYDSDAGSFAYGSGARAYTSGAGRLTPFSQRLHGSVGQTSRTDIFSPGAPITSSGILSDQSSSTQQGTSQAAPVTAGVILLMQEYHKRRFGTLPSVDNLEAWLRNGGIAIIDGDDEDDNVTHTNCTFYRIDASGALAAIDAAQAAPRIMTQPAPRRVQELESTWYYVEASGAGELQYQWQRNGVDLPGANTARYDILQASLNDHGSQYRCRVWNDLGEVWSASATLSINHAPDLVSPLQVNPDPAISGQPVSFEAYPDDQDGDETIVTWNFGDGHTAQGLSVEHVFAAGGTYHITATIHDGHLSVESTATVVVSAQPAEPLQVDHALLKANFAKANKDQCKLKGRFVNAAPALNAGATPISVNVAGTEIDFVLNGRGKGRSAFGKMMLNASKGTFAFQLKGSLHDEWSDEGLVNETTSGPVSIDVLLNIDGQTYETRVSLYYAAKAGKNGKAR